MPPVEFELRVPATKQPQSQALKMYSKIRAHVNDIIKFTIQNEFQIKQRNKVT